MLLTAIVPATNRPATLAPCLAAIEHAAAPPEQVVLVEDSFPKHPSIRGCRLTQGLLDETLATYASRGKLSARIWSPQQARQIPSGLRPTVAA